MAKRAASTKRSKGGRPKPSAAKSTTQGKASKRRYSRSASDEVGSELHRAKRGTARTKSGAKVNSRNQAVAIGLSKARKKGKKVPAREH
ncbi:DUF6496 domain-containing protein [Methylocella sp. CPCC 101449]|uniref:DUF6496 domain-containing protein n=1 Tax=Methylocella sp. CPCC 101449 TaxID=2987531 RepID=UPI002892D5DB|nr:DUF6496 domain-containing protein [Methylocella sp. CPCC 101449]